MLLESGEGHTSVAQSIAVLRAAQEPPGTPVIVLAAVPTEAEHLLALASGADGYLPLGVSPAIAGAQCAALLRRVAGPRASGPVLTMGLITVNTATYEAMIESKPVALTASEFKLLCTLIIASGQFSAATHCNRSASTTWRPRRAPSTRTSPLSVASWAPRAGAS